MTTPLLAGIDVSAWQTHIDWRKVAEAGHAFAFVKATEGAGYVSPTFREQQKLKNSQGVKKAANLAETAIPANRTLLLKGPQKPSAHSPLKGPLSLTPPAHPQT